MDRLSTLARLLSLALVLVMVSACNSKECVDDPEAGEYCEALPTAS
jgi:hypothetical protein